MDKGRGCNRRFRKHNSMSKTSNADEDVDHRFTNLRDREDQPLRGNRQIRQRGRNVRGRGVNTNGKNVSQDDVDGHTNVQIFDVPSDINGGQRSRGSRGLRGRNRYGRRSMRVGPTRVGTMNTSNKISHNQNKENKEQNLRRGRGQFDRDGRRRGSSVCRGGRNRGTERQTSSGQGRGGTFRDDRSSERQHFSANHSSVHGSLPYGRLKDWSELENLKELLIRLTASKDKLKQLLNFAIIKDDWNYNLLNIFYKVCQMDRSQGKIAILALLRGSQFITRHVGNSMLTWRLEGDGEKIKRVTEWLITLIQVYFELFPSSYIDMPLDQLTNFMSKEDKDSIDQVMELGDIRDSLVKEAFVKKKIPRREEICKIGPPPDDFRQIPTVPDVNDIHQEEKPYLRPIKSKGCYDNGEHYLDVQFRLLREDLVAPLREGVVEIIEEIPKKERRHGLKIYFNVYMVYPLCTRNGMIHRLHFDTTYTKGMPWKHSRRLIHGSLLCISKDNFQTIVFATVTNRDPDELEKGLIDVRFDGGVRVEHYFENVQLMQMVESSAYFEAYKHVLDGMKELDAENIPLHQYIVECNANVEAPKYLRHGLKPVYDLKKSLDIKSNKKYVKILNEKSWPNYKETKLNESQLQAIKHALTKEFVVIQGPPGTGKTHVGIRIADALLVNKEYWNADGKTPMLVVCYTNHALDQFLTGMIEFGHVNVIRVGGRASKEMEDYSLRNATMKMKEDNRGAEFKHLRRAKGATHSEKVQAMENINDITKHMIAAQNKLMKGKLVHLRQLQQYMHEEHAEYFIYLDEQCHKLKISVFDIYLQLLPIHQDDVLNYMLVDTETQMEGETKVAKKEDDAIQIEGEGEALVNRWVPDTNEYQTVKQQKKGKHNKEGTDQKRPSYIIDKGGFELVRPKYHKRIVTIQSNIQRYDCMPLEEVEMINDPWSLDLPNRWRLYKFWLQQQIAYNREDYMSKSEELEDICRQFKELQDQEDEIALKNADIIAMTTTCAARLRRVLNSIQPKVVIIEEAAEVLEAHVLTSLNTDVQHLILIGDHKQLKPNPQTFELAKKYMLELSLFQRMVNNGMDCHTLDVQHRMQPDISILLRHIYPNLYDHPSVKNCPQIKGVCKNVVFINHQEKEIEVAHTKSKANPYEASFIKSFCYYLLQQGYSPNQITVLTGYAGQLIQLKNIMPNSLFSGVRVTAVDNFQGEENDIILLSLVRSNADGNIGFLSIDNRICVALSRAKHGLYVIGNFDKLGQKSNLWHEIIQDVKKMGNFKNGLSLYCQNHPEERINAKKSDDFLKAPEGGCTKPCEFRLDCGHVCRMACHPKDPEHKEYKCKIICDKITCVDEHRCKRICHHGEECGPCKTMVKKMVVECEHIQSMHCHQDPDTFDCKAPCKKFLDCNHKCAKKCSDDCLTYKCVVEIERKLLCGHEQMVPCHIEESDIICKHPCNSELDCGHICPGSCGNCKQGRLHIKCKHKCERVLVCSHLCKEPCTSDCPPCSVKCENRCLHSRCEKKCGDICVSCNEKCSWECEHMKCSKLCGELCDRKPCNEPCKDLLQCGHPCIGLCGEICPKLCRICNDEQVKEIFFGTEDEDEARFLVLEDCEHTFEVTGLDNWMMLDNDGENNIKLKECPRCKTIIRKSVRYGNNVKQTLMDLNEIKIMIVHGDADRYADMRNDAYRVFKEINDIIIESLKQHHKRIKRDEHTRITFAVSVHLTKSVTIKEFAESIENEGKNEKISDRHTVAKQNIASKLANNILKTSLGYSELNTLLHQGLLLKRLWGLKKDILNNGNLLEEESMALISAKNMKSLERFIATGRLSLQQLREATVEVNRMGVCIAAKACYNGMIRKTMNGDLRENVGIVEKIVMELESLKKLSDPAIERRSKDIRRFEDKYSINGLSRAEKIEIVTAIGLGKGHWYKCPNGHFYAIGECGGATEKSKCPECGETIGGMDHALVAGNTHAGEFDESSFAAYSEEANNMINLDPEDLRQLQR